MKTIIYSIIICLFCMPIISTIQKSSDSLKSVILQATDTKVTSQMLTQSGRIITERLKTYGLKSSVNISPDKGQIQVELPANIVVLEIEELLKNRGDIGFYETLTLKETDDLLKNSSRNSLSDARLGCSTFENPQFVDSVVNSLKSINSISDYKFLWGLKRNKSRTCLYAIKVKNTAVSPLVRADIENIKATFDNNSQPSSIDIKFKLGSAKTWAVTTSNNLGKPVAIVIGDRIFYTPVVKTTMEDGLCEITGDFTQKEVNYFLALVNNDPLPVNFIIK
jgi:preprotein translocase subunit SecD